MIIKKIGDLIFKTKEQRLYDEIVEKNDDFILELLDELANKKPYIRHLYGDYYFYVNGFKVKVSRYSYIYIDGFDLEHSSASIRASFAMAVRTIWESQQS